MHVSWTKALRDRCFNIMFCIPSGPGAFFGLVLSIANIIYLGVT